MSLLRICVFLLAIFSLVTTKGQDTLELRNGERIPTKVVLVNDDEVLYKQINDPEFLTYTVNIKKIKKIEYEDSTTLRFNHLFPHYVGGSVMLVNPRGEFSASTNGTHGFASVGAGVNISGGLYLWRNWGLHVDFGRFMNPFNGDRFQEAITTDIPDLLDYSEGTWNHAYVLFGPEFTFKMSQDVKGDIGLLFGDLSTSKPEIEYSYQDAEGFTYDVVSGAGEGDGAALGLRFGIRINLTKKIDLGLHFTRLVSDQAIRYADSYKITPPEPVGNENEEYFAGVRRQIVRVTNLQLGISYNFDR